MSGFWLSCLLVIVGGFAGLWFRERLRRLAATQDQQQLLGANGQQVAALAQLKAEVERLQHHQESLLDDISTLKTENASLRKEIDGRPTKTEVRYGIATVGVSGCGKTALTLRWANPRVRPEQVKATQFSKYQRTISRVYDPDSRIHVEHIFEVYDWGGEHIEEALTALVKLGTIHALLVVVDLGPFVRAENRHVFSQEHIDRQLEEFDQQVLRFFFAPAVVQSCKHFVLFINKSDLLSGYPAEIEEKARQYYRRLADDMARYSEQRGVNLQVMVGSADTGTGTNALFPYLIDNILPEEARDEQLIQELQQGTSSGSAASAAPVRPPLLRPDSGSPVTESPRVKKWA